MTTERKNELVSQLIAIVLELTGSSDIDVNLDALITETNQTDDVEMLTIKECTETIKGLTDCTLRQLCAQKKIKYIRTGQGKRGKILINKADLIRFFSS